MNFHVIKEDDLFYLSDVQGMSARESENVSGSGLFTRDTRLLSRLNWVTKPDSLVMLESESKEGYEYHYLYTNRPPVQAGDIPRESILVTRSQTVDGHVFKESGIIHNYSGSPIEMAISYEIDADFADMFEVRGFAAPFEREVHVDVQGNVCSYSYTARDGRKMKTDVEILAGDFVCSWTPLRDTAMQCEFTLCVPAHGHVVWALVARPSIDDTSRANSQSFSSENVSGSKGVHLDVHRSYEEWFSRMPRVAGDDRFAAWYTQGLKDIRMLLTDFGYGRFLVAGVPWYAVPFGRDSLIAARQMMMAAPDIARGTLATLAHFQGKEVNPRRDEQPGKILHELRDGELSRTDVLPFSPYFGSIDSTPLFLVVLADYFQWSGDRAFVREMLPAVKRAFEWIEHYGDRDGDGFVEYWCESDGGIANQGWKDSGDSVMDVHGQLATGPIALAEVQAYVHKAYTNWARIFDLFGDDAESIRCFNRAHELQQAFLHHFYDPGKNLLALALDGGKKPLLVASSNMGQVLWSDILPLEIGMSIAKRMLEPDLFSGYGIRTLSAEEVSYNPLSYHNGSVWPHDTSLILAGMQKYGGWALAEPIVSGLLMAQDGFAQRRLPELFCGFAIDEVEKPVPYPVSCSPQAWAAAVPVFVLEQMLGMEPDAPSGRMTLHPHLPREIDRLTIEDICVGQGKFSVTLYRADDEVQASVLANTTGLTIDVLTSMKGVMSKA
ncbi:glycogen debranching enzyme [Alicyclobacillus sacchari]|uniref:Glycogen debranching enzyme n=1 Tax=Alicyclobacillus sacchari TaxID=392010 RepID=A0A4R8LQ53_9BACL|nr:glycogen debranching N-terminal domain-containing protein [Alicyclobacillus sacchari]TDY49650.1 glycogen debranching enzyme [Alicyclobacillus sacchari]GMA58451.1 hypothetical protein GCM10025858_29540 [Alicyclobacillus sacchari]